MDNNSNVDNENIDESCYMFAQTVGGGRQLGRRQEEGDYIVILLSGLLGGACWSMFLLCNSWIHPFSVTKPRGHWVYCLPV